MKRKKEIENKLREIKDSRDYLGNIALVGYMDALKWVLGDEVE